MTKELSPLERQSKWLFGSVYVVPVWSHIGGLAVGEQFLTRDLARDFQLSDSIVRSVLHRLAAIDLIQPTETPRPTRPNPWEKLESPLWVPLTTFFNELSNPQD